MIFICEESRLIFSITKLHNHPQLWTKAWTKAAQIGTVTVYIAPQKPLTTNFFAHKSEFTNVLLYFFSVRGCNCSAVHSVIIMYIN